jgi:hypothetical protein
VKAWWGVAVIRPHSSRAWVAWLLCSVVGTVLIALPDPDRRLFSISDDHGPGMADLAGALVLVAGWIVLDAQIWRGRRRLLAQPRSLLLLLAFTAVVGALVLVWSVDRDAGKWWLLGVALLAGAQLVAAALATSAGAARRR